MSTKEFVEQLDEDTYLVTSEAIERQMLVEAVRDYQNKSGIKSTYFNENGLINFKIDDIDKLALNAQTNLQNIIKINNIVRFFVNKNDILGKVYEAIETNVNSEWTLSYPNYNESEKETFDEVDRLIRDFNQKINLNRLITESIPMTYLEGNYPMYLRNDGNGNYQVDYYPLGVCEVADYTENGEPYLLINISELKSRLQKIYKKDKKNKALFYSNMDEEIKSTYPEEVFKAYKNNEQYAKLNIDFTGIPRVNNLKRKYGLSPIFKALKSVIRLENIELSDDKNTLVRGKKIIFQKLSKELITSDKPIANITWHAAQAKAHMDLMAALNSQGTSVFTGTPWTESIEYIEPKLELTNVQTKNQYRQEIMTAVGISFLNAGDKAYGSAKISIEELMKTINKIGEQLEHILHKWYKFLLLENGYDVKYCPKIKVINSEKLNMELSMDYAKLLHSQLNASLHTVYSVLGLDVKTEAKLRQEEKENGYEEIFSPRLTSYTTSKDVDGQGRPASNEDLDKQGYDQDYNQNVGR
ncbi:hypothetical protein EDM57_05150 [Brevibacillus gelatini]|uniref:Phage portal protein n=1 Tax=Brevibacillus gelatini TaxID=1655277 RepID=A0A3M8B844_9BACL|nr:hypothetical protein [Brevibacillus gelatini]RNB59530.1 hypothetical protein EDM57_05150 [Brevibacillus gelatini]